ncbi:MAG: patatin-like phospholipase family protein [Akkermansiaceae bacterium]|nr:patatin-like phospholipase family protein [Akkermansiaceae bacterium]
MAPEELRLGRWLDEQEAAFDTLVLQADFDLTSWTRLCLRHADLILVIGKAGSDPQPGPIEAEWERLCEPVARPVCDLVLLQDGAPYRGTAAWLGPRSIRRHYHVCLDSAPDRERGRRLLSGRDVTLVLGGGGARGFAHIGVVRACQELGIPIDRIGGTSMGAVIAGCVAQGMSWEEIREKMRESFLGSGSLRSRTVPFLSIDTGKRFIHMLERLFGDTRIEDLPISYFCISCNLTQAKSVIHREGSLAKWVGASMTVPGFAPPIARDGDLLVDGGLLNNLPADIAKADGTGLVIGVDVSPEVDLRVEPDYSGRPGVVDIVRFWFAAKLKPGTVKPFPGIFAVLNRATTLSSVYRKESLKKMTDVYLKLPVSDCRIFEWKRLDELVEIGYETALEQLKNFDAQNVKLPGNYSAGSSM